MSRITGVGLCAVLAVALLGGVASAKSAKPAALVLHPRFHRLASGVSSVASDGRYVVLGGRGRSVLIDGRTGRRTALSPPELCGYTYIVGGGSVLTSCAGYGRPPHQLYSIATGTWSPVTSGGGTAVAVGSDWIEYYGAAESGCTEHCAYQYSFGDVATGQLRTLPRWAPGATTIPNLNSAALIARLCSPLRVPQGFPTDQSAASSVPNPLTFSGPFAAGLEWHLQGGLYEQRLLLERCGSRLHRVLTTQISSSPSNEFAINRRTVLWLDYRGGPIHGVFLPSLRRFTLALPRPPRFSSLGRRVVLTDRTLYVQDGSGHVIAAASPRPRSH